MLHCVFSFEYEEGFISEDIIKSLHKYTNLEIVPYLIKEEEIEQIPIDDNLCIHFIGDNPEFIQKLKNRRKVLGCSPEFLSNTLSKTTEHELFKLNNVSSLDKTIIKNKITKLDKQFDYPVVIKLDNGSNSDGMSNDSVIDNDDDLIKRVNELYEKYNTDVIIEKYLSGKEFTIAVYKNFVFEPIERIYKNDKIYIPGSVLEERLCQDRILANKIIELARKASIAVGCDSYARIDIRCDELENPYVLEINSLCSIALNSYFELSVEAAGYQMFDIYKWIFELN